MSTLSTGTRSHAPYLCSSGSAGFAAGTSQRSLKGAPESRTWCSARPNHTASAAAARPAALKQMEDFVQNFSYEAHLSDRCPLHFASNRRELACFPRADRSSLRSLLLFFTQNQTPRKKAQKWSWAQMAQCTGFAKVYQVHYLSGLRSIFLKLNKPEVCATFLSASPNVRSMSSFGWVSKCPAFTKLAL